MELSYQIYGKDDVSNERFNFIREQLNFEGEDIYIILSDGQPWIIQSESVRPYPAISMEECAQAQIAELLAQRKEVTEEITGETYQEGA